MPSCSLIKSVRSIVSEDGFQEFVKVVLSNSSSGERMMLIKTLINSWSTSRRLHEPTIHPCLCCGEYEDDLSHYLNCSFLWSIIISSAKLSVNLVSRPPLATLGMSSPNLLGLKLLVCAFRVYHTIKAVHLDEVLLSIANEDPEPRMVLTLDLAQVYLKELGIT